MSFRMAVLQPILSTGAGNHESISLIASNVSRQRAGAVWGFSRTCLITLGLFGDAVDPEDGVCTGGHLVALPFPFPLGVGVLTASPGNSSSPPTALPQDAIPSVLTVLTLKRF